MSAHLDAATPPKLFSALSNYFWKLCFSSQTHIQSTHSRAKTGDIANWSLNYTLILFEVQWKLCELITKMQHDISQLWYNNVVFLHTTDIFTVMNILTLGKDDWNPASSADIQNNLAQKFF